MNSLELIAAERKRQIEKGFDAQHDDDHTEGQIAGAAAFWAVSSIGITCGLGPDKTWEGAHSLILYPFEEIPEPEDIADALVDLTKAGALIVAEMERLQRLSSKPR